MSLISELDGYVREIVYARDGFACVRCGGRSALTPSHILPKGKYPGMRFEVENVYTMCWPCHRHHWHDDPDGGTQWFDAKYPGLRDKLRIAANMKRKQDLKDLRVVLKAMAWRLE